MKELLKYILKGVETDEQLLSSLLVFLGCMCVVPALTFSATHNGYAVVLSILLEIELAKPFMKMFKWFEKHCDEKD